MAKVTIEAVDIRLLKRLQEYPKQLNLVMIRAVREISKSSKESSKKLAPIDTGTLQDSIDVVPLTAQRRAWTGGIAASAPHAYDVHETMAPAGAIRPSELNQARGGVEGSAGGWFFKRVFDDTRNIENYNKILGALTVKSFNTLK